MFIKKMAIRKGGARPGDVELPAASGLIVQTGKWSGDVEDGVVIEIPEITYMDGELSICCFLETITGPAPETEDNVLIRIEDTLGSIYVAFDQDNNGASFTKPNSKVRQFSGWGSNDLQPTNDSLICTPHLFFSTQDEEFQNIETPAPDVVWENCEITIVHFKVAIPV